jgi:cell division protease FtsH
LLAPAEARRLAAHEAGRAVLLVATGRGDEVQRLSVVTAASRQPMPLEREEEGKVQTAAQLEDRITACFGGRAGEEVVVGSASTLGEHDMARATELAYDLVTRYGLSDAVGPRVIVPPGLDLPAQAAVTMLSPEAQAAVDAEVADVLRAAHRRAVSVISGVRSELLTLVDMLNELETLEGEELDELLPRPVERRAPVARRPKAPTRQVAEQP